MLFNKEIKDQMSLRILLGCMYGRGCAHVVKGTWVWLAPQLWKPQNLQRERRCWVPAWRNTSTYIARRSPVRESRQPQAWACMNTSLRTEVPLHWLTAEMMSNRVRSIRRPLQSDVPKVIPKATHGIHHLLKDILNNHHNSRQKVWLSRREQF